MDNIEDRIHRFYIGSLALIVVLGVFGYLVTEHFVTSTEVAQTQMRPQVQPMAYVELPRVNVSFGGPFAMQMQLDLALEVEPKNVMVVEGYIPQVMDRLNAYFPKARLDSMNERSHGMFLFRKEVLWEVNQIGMPVPVNDILIQKLVVQ